MTEHFLGNNIRQNGYGMAMATAVLMTHSGTFEVQNVNNVSINALLCIEIFKFLCRTLLEMNENAKKMVGAT